MAREDPSFKLRMPEGLKTSLEQAASEARRSLNSEIVDRLQKSLDRDEDLLRALDGPDTGHEDLQLKRAFEAGMDAVLRVLKPPKPKKAR